MNSQLWVGSKQYYKIIKKLLVILMWKHSGRK